MDLAVFVSVSISFFLFVLIHFFVFRRIKKERVIHGLLVTFFMGNFVSFLVISFVLFYLDVTFDNYIVLWIVSFVLFNLFSLSYILGFFGMMVASLRLRILREIYFSDGYGIKSGDLLKKYNEKQIVDERIKRLLSSRELIKKGNTFFLINTISVFRLHHKLYMLFKKLYA